MQTQEATAHLKNPARLMSELSQAQRHNLAHLQSQLQQYWRLGRNIVISWSDEPNGIGLVVAPYYVVEPLTARHTHALITQNSTDMHAPQSDSPEAYLKALMSGTRQVPPVILNKLAQIFDVEAVHIVFPHPDRTNILDVAIIDDIVKRYSISYVENRAVVLLDIVGFSIHDPFIQTMQLNSLAYSINSAQSKLLNKEMYIDFARSTTGDGFYLWNRDYSMQGNMDLYYLMNLVLADNAIARQASIGDSAPLLKTGFHVGDCYEFFQIEGLQPTTYNYIVGDVTIELARLIEKALPGQILVGDFKTFVVDEIVKDTSLDIELSSIGFIEKLKNGLTHLNGVELSSEKIDSIQCYLTGRQLSPNKFNISKYRIVDKHGLERYAFNAKMNIYRGKGPPIYLGIQESRIKGLERSAVVTN